LNNPSLSLRRLLVGAVIVAALVLTVISLARSAGGDKRLDRIKGNVGYTTAPDAPLHQVFGQDELADDDYAITRAASAAQVVLPDSSIVALGENTNVRVGAFTTGTAGPGSTIVVNGGSLRFDIHRPAGGAANYHFTTTTSQIAVRGTVGLLSFLGGNTTVACLACAADSVTVTTGTQTITLVTGQVVTVSAAGAVVTGTVTSTTLTAFSSAQVSTVAASGPSAAVAGVTGAVGTTAGVATGTIAAAAAGAAAVGATVSAIAHTATPAPTPLPTPTAAPTASPTPTPTPSPSPTPNAPIQIQKLTPPAATAAPASVAPRPAAAPESLPVPEFPGGPHRGAH
jgi:hypothetical protein